MYAGPFVDVCRAVCRCMQGRLYMYAGPFADVCRAVCRCMQGRLYMYAGPFVYECDKLALFYPAITAAVTACFQPRRIFGSPRAKTSAKANPCTENHELSCIVPCIVHTVLANSSIL
jgi:hypothetical protein